VLTGVATVTVALRPESRSAARRGTCPDEGFRSDGDGVSNINDRNDVDVIPGEVLRDERKDDVGIVSFDEHIATVV
jgi:hypothetical protein